jgi:hypothetical protein
MHSGAEGPGIAYMNNPRAKEALERFAESAAPDFECFKIVGRRLDSLDDHAAYVRDGGCSGIIEVLAAPLEIDGLTGDTP